MYMFGTDHLFTFILPIGLRVTCGADGFLDLLNCCPAQMLIVLSIVNNLTKQQTQGK